MPFLSFISNQDLISCIDKLYNAYQKSNSNNSLNNFYKNKVDPIKMHFDTAFNGLSYDSYIESELIRQHDKSINNAIGEFHQNLLGCINGLINLGVGNGCDITNSDHTIFAEIKNKHNTMNSSSAEATIQKLISFANDYPNATCYCVQIIAKQSIDQLWCGSYNGAYYSHPRVRLISADKFYELVTGIPDAFIQLCNVLPVVTKLYLQSREESSITPAESKVYSQINNQASLNRVSFYQQLLIDNFNTYNGI